MPEIDVKKQSHEQQRGRGELQRRGAFPSLFDSRHGDLWNASPFALMRRLTDDMDRLFSRGEWHGSRGNGVHSGPAV